MTSDLAPGQRAPDLPAGLHGRRAQPAAAHADVPAGPRQPGLRRGWQIPRKFMENR